MASYLAAHPDICWSEPKELWYFCRPDFPHRRRQSISLDDYLEHFSHCGSVHRYLAEGSVSYLYAEGAVSRILEFNPDAKFVVMLRNPMDAVISLHRQMLMNMQESEADFERAWSLQEARRQGRHVPVKCENPKYLMYRDWCLWGRQLERVFRIAGRDRVCVLLFDDFVREPRHEYEKVLDFLGLDTDHRSEFPVENAARAYQRQKFVNIIDYLLLYGSALRRRLKFSGRFNLLSTLLRQMKQGQVTRLPKVQLSRSMHEELADAFRTDMVLLSRLLDRDLMHWLDYGQ